jgi:hypothetical protein
MRRLQGMADEIRQINEGLLRSARQEQASSARGGYGPGGGGPLIPGGLAVASWEVSGGSRLRAAPKEELHRSGMEQAAGPADEHTGGHALR